MDLMLIITYPFNTCYFLGPVVVDSVDVVVVTTHLSKYAHTVSWQVAESHGAVRGRGEEKELVSMETGVQVGDTVHVRPEPGQECGGLSEYPLTGLKTVALRQHRDQWNHIED